MKQCKRLLALLLCLAMVMPSLAVAASATETEVVLSETAAAEVPAETTAAAEETAPAAPTEETAAPETEEVLETIAASDASVATSGVLTSGHSWDLDLSTGTLTIHGDGEGTTQPMDLPVATDVPWSYYWEQIRIARFEEGITGIGNATLHWATKLTTVYFPSTLRSIFTGVFAECVYLQDVYTAQTPDQWNMMTSYPHSFWSGNDYLLSANVHYTGSMEPAPDTTLTIWSYPVGNTDALTDLIIDFSREHPELTIEHQVLNYTVGDDKINAAIEAGNAPDLIFEGPERLVANWGARGVMVNIADLFSSSDKAEIYPGALNACFADAGTAYMYPLVGTVHSMAINKTVFEAAGAMKYIDQENRTWTTENFLKAIETVYAYTGKPVGTVYCGGQGGDQGTRALVTNLYGGSYTNDACTEYTWNSPAVISALETLQNFGTISFDASIAGGDEIALLRNGVLNMSFCWNSAQQKQSATTNRGDEIMVMSFPSPFGTDAQLEGGVWGLGIVDNGSAARIENAKKLIRYICDSPKTAEAVKSLGYLPIRSSVDGTDLTKLYAGNPTAEDYARLMPMLGRYSAVTPNWSEARTQWWNMLQEIGTGADVTATTAKYTALANGKPVPDTPVVPDIPEDPDSPAPVLTYRWIQSPGDNLWGLEDWDMSWNEGLYGYSHMRCVPGEERFLAFYLNTWNSRTESWDYTPVHVEFGEHLSGTLLKDTDFGFLPEAVDTDYYYQVFMNESGWDKNTYITYNYHGTPVSVEVELRRNEADFYSTNAMRNDTHINAFYANQLKDSHSFYYGFDSEYWTLVSATATANWIQVSGYDASKAVTMTPVGGSMYKITVDPWLVSAAVNFEIQVTATVKGPDGEVITDWTDSIWCHTDWDARKDIPTIWLKEKGKDPAMFEFTLVDGVTKSYSLHPTDKYFEWGDQIYTYNPTPLPAGVSYDIPTNTLTLNNVTLDELDVEYNWYNPEDGVSGTWLPSRDLKIKLIGRNELSFDGDAPLFLRGGVNAIFTGDGSMNIIATNNNNRNRNGDAYSFNAIQMFGESTLTIAGNAKVTAEIRGTGLETCWEGDTKLGERNAYLSAIAGDNGNLVIKENGSLKTILPAGARSNGPKDDTPIWGDEYPGGYRGIADMGKITIAGNGRLETTNLILGNWWDDSGNITRYGEYHQSGGTVIINAIPGIFETEKIIWNEELGREENLGIVDHYNYNGLGNHDGGKISITGGNLTVNCNATDEQIASSAHCSGLFTGYDGTIQISGGNINVNVTTGIAVETGTLKVSGGTLNAKNPGGEAIYALNTMNFSGGTVTATGMDFGMNVNDCDLTISGSANVTTRGMVVGFWQTRDDPHRPDNSNGTLNITGGKLNVIGDLGLWPLGEMTLTGGELNIDGGISGFAPQTIQGSAKVNISHGGYWQIFNILKLSGNPVLTLDVHNFGIHDSINDDGSKANDGALIMDGGKITVNGKRINPEQWAIMEVTEGGEIVLNSGSISVTAENEINLDEDWTPPVEFNRDSKVTINGGSFTINAKDYHQGLVNRNSLTVNGGTLSVTNNNEKAGIFLTPDGKGAFNFFACAMHNAGYFTINNGEVKLDSYVGLDHIYDSGDASNPDWPAWPNTKFTMNGGTLTVKGQQQGISLGAPAEVKGGTIQVNVSGVIQPIRKFLIGQGLIVYGNGNPEVGSGLTISGGKHTFTAATSGDNCMTYGGIVDSTLLNITGGSVTFDAVKALCAQGIDPSLKTMIQVGSGLVIVSQPDGTKKDMLSGDYLYTFENPETGETTSQKFYINSFEHDDTFEGEPWWNGEADECSKLVISAPTTEPTITRVAGGNRIQTAVASANTLKEILDVDKFQTILVADARNFPDALSGSYLAAVTGAPILLHSPGNGNVPNYINANLETGGTVYILGGTSSVPEELETSLRGDIHKIRIAGRGRWETSLKIIAQADALRGEQPTKVLICTGRDFADSLSASATGLPILLVDGIGTSLSQEQKAYLSSLDKAELYVIGGSGSVNDTILKALHAYDADNHAQRVAGSGRELTSVEVAKTFFPETNGTALAYSREFADGLSGGPVAFALDAPLLLIRSGKEAAANAYVEAAGITNCYIIGGEKSIPMDSANAVFGK
ncbi:MAG: extracellular solute-binding protein [Oscillospiraceae bacterium]|nr:extracellular solute-binding protein [Oscillospiraceae bacterium]